MSATKLLFIKMNNDSKFQQFVELKYNYLYKKVIACSGWWDNLDELSTEALMDYHKNTYSI